LNQAFLAFEFFGSLIPVLSSPFIYRQYQRFGRLAGVPLTISACIILYACAIVTFTLFPFPDESASQYCRLHAHFDYWQTQPLGSLDDILRFYTASGHDLPATLASGVFLQVFFNVVLFIPLGFFIAYRTHLSFLGGLLAGFGLSLLVELTQGTALWWQLPCPYRVADVDDLITNTTGAGIGWLLAATLDRWLPNPLPRAIADLNYPSVWRQGLAFILDILLYSTAMTGVGLIAQHFAVDLYAGPWLTAAITLAVTVLLFLMTPMWRADRATLGAVSVNLALVHPRTHRTASRTSVFRRWLVRWLPLALVGLIWPLIVLLVDALFALFRPDRRAASGLLSNSLLITRAQHRCRLRIDQRRAQRPAPVTEQMPESRESTIHQGLNRTPAAKRDNTQTD
jgi:glycopeptide antibiotics resistance protein